MGFRNAYTGVPPGVAGSTAAACPHRRGYLLITVRNLRANGQPVMPNEAVSVSVGAAQADLVTDAQGRVTFAFDDVTDFQNVDVNVILQDVTRAWQSRINTQLIGAAGMARRNHTLSRLDVRISGWFSLQVRIWTRKPGDAANTQWVAARGATPPQLGQTVTPRGGAAGAAVNFNFAASPDPIPVSRLHLINVACHSSHDLSLGNLNGLISAETTMQLRVDGGAALVAANVAATTNEVTYTLRPNGVLRLSVERHDALVLVDILVKFRQILIVGEGTSYEYAVGLANKYGNAAIARGFKWIVATQYDVTDPAAVSNNMDILDWDTGNQLVAQDQRQNIATALGRNLIRRAAQFDATDTAHWAGVLATYGAFDACVFNNPHIGYGVHMCVVLGLTSARGLGLKNGMGVSVYSFGHHATLTPLQVDALRGSPVDAQAVVKSRGRQRTFVRTNAANCLNHANARGDAIPGQFDPATTASLAVTIDQAFVYARDGVTALAANYGADNEFANNTVVEHYQSRLDTIGLQGCLLRSYRHHGPTALKPGGWLYVNGSNAWSNELTAGFNFTALAGVVPVAGMANQGFWAGSETFVRYNTNFTSTSYHPSWYSKWNFAPGEPGLNNARVYALQKP